MDSTFDRRKYPRVKTEALISIARVDEKDLVARTVDLSLGGLRFQCVALEVDLDELLRVALKVRDREVSLIGKLVRITDLDELTQELALAFVEVDAAALELIEAELFDSQDL
jgi:c-di-GMP-binding flagellar brake protein YcgR